MSFVERTEQKKGSNGTNHFLHVKQVERRFLSLEDLKPKEKEFNVSLKIHSTGAWILKFRQSGVIYNRQ